MGITHKEFFRNIPRALQTDRYARDGEGVTLQGEGRSLRISLSEESQRRIALITLPVTHVTLTFNGYDEAAVGHFMEGFDRAFQRGGG